METRLQTTRTTEYLCANTGWTSMDKLSEWKDTDTVLWDIERTVEHYGAEFLQATPEQQLNMFNGMSSSEINQDLLNLFLERVDIEIDAHVTVFPGC